MIIELKKWDKNWRYNINEWNYTQKQFDYMCKYLDFDKLDKDWHIIFNNEKTKEWFYKTYTSSHDLNKIYNHSPKGYQYLKNNWSKGVFKILVNYPDKQELKTIVNRVINIELKKGVNYEN